MEDGVKNAKIIGATISTADYNQLIAALTFDYGGIVQGLGPFTLYNPKDKNKDNVNLGGFFIYHCMEVVGVSDWKAMIGKPVRVRVTDRRIEAIGNFLEDNWFFPEREYERLLGKENF